MDDIELREDRDRLLQLILRSEALRKLIVAGPGVGKTHSFSELLEVTSGDKLVLTFVRTLVDALNERLGGLADVRTFHAFAKWMLMKHAAHGMSSDPDYYPGLNHIFAADARAMLGGQVQPRHVQHVIHAMLIGDELLDTVLASGSYYDAVGHDDSVLRVVRHFADHPDDIPFYSLLLVDEYQDFNLLEVSLIEQLASRCPTLIVGDDDQALYLFKDASPEHLRALAAGTGFESFELPYCSRCTEVLVQGTNQIVEKALEVGCLDGRVKKRFECYMPDKRADSQRYPLITHARCSVDRDGARYMGKYIQKAMAEIPHEDIEESWREGYPTVLIAGPGPFWHQMRDYLSAEGVPNLKSSEASTSEPDLLDAYRRLAVDPRSRLGWRIATFCDAPDRRPDLVRSALGQGTELADLLSDDYKESHLRVAAPIGKLIEGNDLTPEEISHIESQTGRSLDDLRVALRLVEVEPLSEDKGKASVVVTSLERSKGLQAGHVFVVGAIEGHFPKDNSAPTDHEVCCMIVALTRATKRCHLVSCVHPLGERASSEPSVFVRWLDGLTEFIYVNQEYVNQP